MQQIKSVILSAVLLAAGAGCTLASFGALSDLHPEEGQNQFGGFGKICTTGNQFSYYFYDDTNFYCMAEVPGWDYADTELYAYDLKTGAASSVCQRISCSHLSGDCPLHSLYSDLHSSHMFLVDDGFIAPFQTDDTFEVIFWDPLANTRKTMLTLPFYQSLTDSSGMEGKYETYFNSAMRLSADRLMIGYNGEMHIYDNAMNDLGFIASNDLSYPVVAGNTLCWLDMIGRVNSYSLDTGMSKRDVMKGLLPTKKKTAILYYDYPFVWFAYRNQVYFSYKNQILAFDPEQNTLNEVTAIDPLSKASPYAFLISENQLYYQLNGTVCCMNLDSGEVTGLPDLPQVPAAAVRDLLLTVPAQPKGESGEIRFYDRSGKAVTP